MRSAAFEFPEHMDLGRRLFIPGFLFTVLKASLLFFGVLFVFAGGAAKHVVCYHNYPEFGSRFACSTCPFTARLASRSRRGFDVRRHRGDVQLAPLSGAERLRETVGMRHGCGSNGRGSTPM